MKSKRTILFPPLPQGARCEVAVRFDFEELSGFSKEQQGAFMKGVANVIAAQTHHMNPAPYVEEEKE